MLIIQILIYPVIGIGVGLVISMFLLALYSNKEFNKVLEQEMAKERLKRQAPPGVRDFYTGDIYND